MVIIYMLIGMLIGALLVTLGGFMAIWYLTKKARQIRREEIIAEKRIEANREGFNHITDLRSMMQQNTPEQVLEWIGQNEKWFVNSRLFLPGKFVQKWLSIGKYCQRLVKLKTRHMQMNDEMRKAGVLDEMRECESYCTRLADEALDEIYRDMDIAPIAIEEPEDQT